MFDTQKYPDLWSYLVAAGRPIAIYGMGNGGDKLIGLLKQHGLIPAAVFASDEFVRGQQYRGYTVKKAAQVFEECPDCIVLVAFGSRLPQVMDRIKVMATEHELYIPDLPVAGDPADGFPYFCADFYAAYEAEFAHARSLFADEESRRVFDLAIKNKLTGDVSALFGSVSENVYEEVWRQLLHPASYRSFLDLGAYRGDTFTEFCRLRREMAAKCSESAGAVAEEAMLAGTKEKGDQTAADFNFFAFEPDPKNFKKLTACVSACYGAGETCSDGSVRYMGAFRYALYPFAAWCEEGSTVLDSGGNRNSNIFQANAKGTASLSGAKAAKVTVAPPDALVEHADYIKYDVEGAEYEAILGSERLIRRASALSVAAYHRPDDLFRLPILIHGIDPSYKLYLRRKCCVPLWEMDLYAVR